ncbi:MAG TPA: hypothetical protein VIK71_03510 [Flavobacteriales bacterium]
MKKYITLIFLALVSYWGLAQTPQILFYGYVEEGVFENPNSTKKRKKEKAPEKLSGVKIYVYEGDSVTNIVNARETGFYAILLNAGKRYRVTFEKEGFFCKSFEMDCRDAKFPETDAALKCLTDVSMFKKIEDDDLLSLCRIPYAKCSYQNGEMVWDMEYTARAREKFYELAQPYYMAMEK